MAAKTNPIIEALMAAAAEPNKSQSKVDQFFGDQPDVLEAIVVARRDKKLTFAQIAKILSKASGQYISGGSVSGWLSKRGID
jgi:hypothetical protein